MKLNNTQIKALKPKDKQYKVSDGRGLNLVIHPNGSKYWRLFYRFEGKQKTLALGVYPMISLAEARDQTMEAKTLIAQGIDPSAAKRQTKEKRDDKFNFKNIARLWRNESVENKEWSRNHELKVWRTLEMNVFPYFGHKDIKDISAPEIKEVLKQMEKRGATELLKKVKQRCSAVFNYAISEGMTDNNPTLALKFRKHIAENHNHISYQDLPELVQSIELGNLTPTVKAGLKIALLTFQRTQEIRFAEWQHIDFENALWHIPAEIMKMKRDHIVPLSTQAIAILKALQPITGHYKYVFASNVEPDQKPMNSNALINALYALGWKHRMTTHGFRHLASTTLHECGFDPRHIEKQLSHENKNVIAGTYNKAEYLAERIKMMQLWADLVDNADGKNIIPINRNKQSAD